MKLARFADSAMENISMKIGVFSAIALYISSVSCHDITMIEQYTLLLCKKKASSCSALPIVADPKSCGHREEVRTFARRSKLSFISQEHFSIFCSSPSHLVNIMPTGKQGMYLLL